MLKQLFTTLGTLFVIPNPQPLGRVRIRRSLNLCASRPESLEPRIVLSTFSADYSLSYSATKTVLPLDEVSYADSNQNSIEDTGADEALNSPSGSAYCNIFIYYSLENTDPTFTRVAMTAQAGTGAYTRDPGAFGGVFYHGSSTATASLTSDIIVLEQLPWATGLLAKGDVFFKTDGPPSYIDHSTASESLSVTPDGRSFPIAVGDQFHVSATATAHSDATSGDYSTYGNATASVSFAASAYDIHSRSLNLTDSGTVVFTFHSEIDPADLDVRLFATTEPIEPTSKQELDNALTGSKGSFQVTHFTETGDRGEYAAEVPLAELPEDILDGSNYLLLNVDSNDKNPLGRYLSYEEAQGQISLMAVPLPGGAELIGSLLSSDNWNAAIGGLDFQYLASGNFDKPTVANIYWASGVTESSKLSSIPVFSTEIPAGDRNGSFPTSVHVPGYVLKNSPPGTTYLLVVLDDGNVIRESNESNNIVAIQDVQVHYKDGTNDTLTRLSEYSIGIIKDALRQAGSESAWVTDTRRSASDQAKTMFNLLYSRDAHKQNAKDIIKSIKQQKKLYADAGDAVIDSFEKELTAAVPSWRKSKKNQVLLTDEQKQSIIAGMASEVLNRIRGTTTATRNFFLHVVQNDIEWSQVQAVDVSQNKFPSEASRQRFVSSINSDTRIETLFNGKRSLDHTDADAAIHFVIEQKLT